MLILISPLAVLPRRAHSRAQVGTEGLLSTIVIDPSDVIDIPGNGGCPGICTIYLFDIELDPHILKMGKGYTRP